MQRNVRHYCHCWRWYYPARQPLFVWRRPLPCKRTKSTNQFCVKKDYWPWPTYGGKNPLDKRKHVSASSSLNVNQSISIYNRRITIQFNKMSRVSQRFTLRRCPLWPLERQMEPESGSIHFLMEARYPYHRPLTRLVAKLTRAASNETNCKSRAKSLFCVATKKQAGRNWPGWCRQSEHTFHHWALARWYADSIRHDA